MKFAAQVAVILALAGGIAAIDSSLRPPQLTVKVTPKPPATVPKSDPGTAPKADPSAPVPAPAETELGPEISLQQAKALFDQGITFVDARLTHEYTEGHIRFALHLDSNELGSPESAQVLAKLVPSQRLVIYCGGGDCHASHNLAIYLQQAGYIDVHIFKDGYPSWKSANYDITTGDQP